MNDFKLEEIETVEEYECYLQKVEELMENDPTPDTPKGKLLLALTPFIEQ
ncbi:MAG: hypothetical protein KF856_15835 [Cyclobacteriaceae bacterium]|nr:hypothetical protein [Cyclobacteriaceae bacterium]